MTLCRLRLPPLLSDGSVTLEHWYKQPGDPVAPGDPLLLVRTEHLVIDLPAPVSGTLTQLYYAPGDTLQAGTPLATIEQPDSPPTDRPAPLAVRPTPRPVRVSPLARKLATVHGYDLTTITGSGYGGRIVQADIVRLHSLLSPQSSALTPNDHRIIQADTVSPLSSQFSVLSPRPSSLVPVALTVMQVEIDQVLTAGQVARQGPRGVVVTLATCVAHAVSQELLTHRLLQAIWDDAGLILPRQMALAIEDGDVRHVIRDAAALSLRGLTRALADSTVGSEPAGTFSIRTSSARWTEAWLAPGSTATLTIGLPTVRPIVVATPAGDHIEPHPTTLLTLCYDARILTQPEADAFLSAVKQRVECLQGA